ncbi:MAG: peptide chain release factor N(5)-glutamine methyltransferase [Burkholderiales bacterium]|nr:MAG: peptide chain release factor N(5)-glutamine methyltransferase [Burkholderiales bacterium]
MVAAASNWERLALDSGLPRLEARVLLERASGRTREWLVAHGDEPADPAAASAFAELARRRRAGEPIAYLTGTREFLGRRFEVSPEVLIPRPETELLVQKALERAPHAAQVLDLGTGSGAIAVSLACERGDLRVTATDRSTGALAVARRNAQHLAADALARARLRFCAGSWWAAIDPGERFDLVVSNPPYVAADDAHLASGDLRFEPRAALAAGADGLDALREIVAGAPRHLQPGGWLLLEHGHQQGEALRALLAAAGLRDVETLADAAGLARATVGRMPE